MEHVFSCSVILNGAMQNGDVGEASDRCVSRFCESEAAEQTAAHHRSRDQCRSIESIVLLAR